MSSRLACALCAIALVGAALDAADVRVTVPGLAAWQAERTQAITCYVAAKRELMYEEDRDLPRCDVSEQLKAG